MANVDELIRAADRCAREGRIADARELGMRALAENPEHVGALYLVGSIDLIEKRYEAGAAALEKLLSIQPTHIDALNNYGLYQMEHCRDRAAALRCFNEILRSEPDNVNAVFNLGTTYLAENQLDDAERYFVRVLEIEPGHAGALNNMGATLVRKGRRDAAIPYYRRALAAAPGDTEVIANLMISAMAIGDKTLGLELFEGVLALDDPGAAVFPACAFAKMGCFWDELGRLVPNVIERIFDGRCSLSSFETVNLPLLATPQVSTDTLFAIHETCGAIIEGLRQKSPIRDFCAVRGDTHRLRIGYLSPDFRTHVVNAFFRGLINHHDRDRFEIHCYSNVRHEDEITAQYRRMADGFVQVVDLSDEQLAARIHADRIHILVDLAGYTQNSRTAVLGHRAAPVQIMYLGYPYTSGIAEVDYFISDPYLDGPANAAYFTECQLRLPESFITLDALHEQEIDPVAPVDRNGHVSFGSLNNIYKLNPEVVQVWAQVLAAVPESRMIINHPNCDLAQTRTRILDEFRKNGIAEHRIKLVWEKHPGGSHLRHYNDIDIVLDAFPLTGGTTTIDALWMGVPVVTLVGDIFPQRLSYSILSNVGVDLAELIAFSRDEYVAKAVALGRNADRVRELHRLIPEALGSSILCDPVRLTRHMEAAFIEAWNATCPDHPAQVERVHEPVTYLPVAFGVEVATDGDLDALDTYVISEQQGWFDPEYQFVLDWFAPGMNALDVNAGHGVYALPLARKATHGAVMATTATPREGRYLQRGKDHGALDNLDIIIKGERRLLLDLEMRRHGWTRLDLIRLNLQPFETHTLDDGAKLFAEHSPLVMFNIKRGSDAVDASLTARFRAWGYAIYRFVPGLGLLAPFHGEDELDAFALNLFACKDDRARQVAATGALVAQFEALEEFPGVEQTDWGASLSALAYAKPLTEGWVSSMKGMPDWEAYWSALNLFVRARRRDLRPAQRMACLTTSLGILVMLAQASPTLPRLLSLARVLSDAGKREQAASLLQQLVDVLEQPGTGLDSEPFLCPCAHFEAIDPGQRTHAWALAAAVEQFERLRVFSSYFTVAEMVPLLEKLVASGFQSRLIDRRLALLRERLSLPKASTG